MIICQPSSEKGNSYFGKRFLEGRFSIQFHQNWKLLKYIEKLACQLYSSNKSSVNEIRSLIYPSYSLSEYVAATLDQNLLCGKVVETLRNSFRQLTFTLKTWMDQRWRNIVDCGSVPRRCQKPSR